MNGRLRDAAEPRSQGKRVSPPELPRFLGSKAESVGIRLSETTSEAARDRQTVSARSWNSCPATPVTNTIGRKTQIVVSVAAVTAPVTSLAPRAAACARELPRRRCRSMASSTTIELSTSMPTPRARPPRDMMLKETPASARGRKDAMTEVGIETAMITVAPRSRRKKYSTSTARMPPRSAAESTWPTASPM